MPLNFSPSSHNKTPYDHDPANGFPLLHFNERKNITQQLEVAHDATDVSTILDLIYGWKDNSYCDDAQTLEYVFRKSHAISAPVRNGALNGRQPQGDEEEIALEIQDCSEQCITYWFGQSLSVYRGIQHTLPKLVVGMLDNPNYSNHRLQINLLNNVTDSWRTASHFGHVVLEWTISSNDVMIAADHIFPYPQHHQHAVRKAHGELRVQGDALDQVDTANIYPSYMNQPLENLFMNVGQNTNYEHGIVAAIVNRIGIRGLSVTTQHARQTLFHWLSAYYTSDPLAARNIDPVVQSIT